jgi:tRNA (guanine-N7-)-methyltransferase
MTDGNGTPTIKLFLSSTVPLPSAPGPDPGYFISDVPTDLEIGCGVGWHCITHAQNHPERRLIAIEHTAQKYEKFRRRLHNHAGLENVLPVHANAVHWITHYVPPQSVQTLFTLFPNPYPKPSQSNKRWHRMPFTERLIDCLHRGGHWVMATNEGTYATEALEYLSRNGRLKIKDRLLYSLTNPAPWAPRTHFEKKYLLAGHTCTQLVFERV